MIAVWIVALAVSASGEEQATSVDKDFARLQGSWETTIEREGTTYLIRKEVEGKRETLQTFQDGNLLHEHTVDIALEHTGRVRIFQWTNGEITVGFRKGQKMPDGACIYRIQGEAWYCLENMLENDEGPVVIMVYRRPK